MTVHESYPRIDFERRGGERLVRAFPVRLGSRLVEALDVSRTGLKILADAPLSPGEELEVWLEVEPNLRLRLTGTPVWQQPLNRAGRTMVGLRFQGGDEAGLQSWLSQHNAA